MCKTYISPTLLNAFTNGYDWVSMVKREPVEVNQAMINGNIFEEEIQNGNIVEASEYIHGSIYQPLLHGLIDNFYLFGYADFLLPTKIVDAKFKQNYEVGHYYNTNQHLIYTYLANINDFVYLIGTGTNPKEPSHIFYEFYTRNDKLLLSRLYDFDRALDRANLRKTFEENYSLERKKEIINGSI